MAGYEISKSALKRIGQLAANRSGTFSGGVRADFDFMPQDVLVWKSGRNLNVTGTSIHQRMILKIILSGRCTMLVDGLRIPMETGDMLCLFPYQFHTTRLECPRREYSFLAVTFTEKNRNYSSFLALKNHLLTPDEQDAANLEKLVVNYHRTHAVRTEHSIFPLLEILLNQRRKMQCVFPVRDENADLFDRICDYVRGHFTENISLKTLAAEFQVTPETIRRQFLYADAGITPGRLIQQLRIQLAAELLQHTPEGIGFIARQCGYSDPFTFSRAFKNAMGHSPRMHRQLLKK